MVGLFQNARARHVPRVRQQQHLRPVMQLSELFRFCSLRSNVHGQLLQYTRSTTNISSFTATALTLRRESFRSCSTDFLHKLFVCRRSSSISLPPLPHLRSAAPNPRASMSCPVQLPPRLPPQACAARIRRTNGCFLRRRDIFESAPGPPNPCSAPSLC